MLEFLRCFLLQQFSSVELHDFITSSTAEAAAIASALAAAAKRFAFTSCSALKL
jgi:hypothetical protein